MNSLEKLIQGQVKTVEGGKNDKTKAFNNIRQKNIHNINIMN